jgi:hypothetical protein
MEDGGGEMESEERREERVEESDLTKNWRVLRSDGRWQCGVCGV